MAGKGKTGSKEFKLMRSGTWAVIIGTKSRETNLRNVQGVKFTGVCDWLWIAGRGNDTHVSGLGNGK